MSGMLSSYWLISIQGVYDLHITKISLISISPCAPTCLKVSFIIDCISKMDKTNAAMGFGVTFFFVFFVLVSNVHL